VSFTDPSQFSSNIYHYIYLYISLYLPL
jgi:hypothetical protein